jgi:hypothetical protein
MELKQVVDQLQAQVAEMLKLVQDRDAQLKEIGAVRSDLAKRIDAQDARIMELVEQAKAATARADELEKKAGRVPFGGDDAPKSFGEQFIGSEQYKEMVARKSLSSHPFEIKGSMLKAITSDPLSAGAMVIPMRVPEIIVPPTRALRLRDLLTVDSTGSNAVEYVQEIGFSNLYTILTADALAAATDIVVESVAGLYVGQTINIGGENRVIAADGIDEDTNTVIITVGLTAGKTAGDPVTSKFFAPTAEGKTKPEGNIAYELKSVPVRTIAHLIPVSRQILADASQLRGQIDSRLIYGLSLVEEEQVLYGDGTGENILGIMANIACQSYNWSQGKVGDTVIDAIRRAMTLARIAEYPVDGVVVHPTDWEEIELTKDSESRYIWISVNDGGQPRLWRVPVVDTTAIRVGEFLVGAFKMGATLYDREQSMIRVSDSHKDFFGKNLLALLAEERAALATFRPEAFVKGAFDEAPSV